MGANKPKVIIAGAGGGKTHQMINEIIKIIPELKRYPEKFCAVVTYTNSATEEIKQRISKVTTIPNNLHISTTHSFFIKFIIEPYAHLFNLLPIDKFYIEKYSLTENQLNWYKTKIGAATRKFVIDAKVYKDVSNLSIEKGIVVYDKILEISEILVNVKSICNIISSRLKYIFVDEYQDMRILQHNIFQKIIESNSTNFYCIGDPLQSIFHFAYTESHLGRKEKTQKTFEESPILQCTNSTRFVTETITQNNRCSRIIIDLINNFNRVLKYEQELPSTKVCNQIPVYFLTGKDKNEIISKFETLITNHKIQKELNKMFSLILADKWSEFNDIANYNPVGNSSDSSRTVFNECSRIVLGSLGINRTMFLDIIPFTDKEEKILQLRQFCFSILKDIRNPSLNVNSDFIVAKFFRTFKIRLPDNTNKSIDISKGIEKLKITSKVVSNDKYCSSIHTSKGLEASSVLVIARTNNQLLKWLDFPNVVHNTDDEYRLGYVAFSRAKEMLCITSIEKPSAKTIEILTKLKIEIV